jgi:hypothetical protein
MNESSPGITVEWIERKGHCLFSREGRKLAYTRAHGDGRRWDVFDGGYGKAAEISAATREEAIVQVTAMLADGSIERTSEKHRQYLVDAQRRVAESLSERARTAAAKAGKSSG